VKDVSGLLFSGIDAGVTRTDLFRFMKVYSGKTLRKTMTEDKRFWQAVIVRAQKLYLRDHGARSKDLMALNG
jgi:heptose I phosphotransferase